MAKIIKELTIEAEYQDYAVEYPNRTYGTTMQMACSDELEAAMYADLLDGQVMSCTVFVSGWVVHQPRVKETP